MNDGYLFKAVDHLIEGVRRAVEPRTAELSRTSTETDADADHTEEPSGGT